ncbi:hypothetical protein HRR83_000780 [Exophiala dermatitidis]|uniref:Uncharacterized protein n=1 Tax=Exophiala dermatitidis TaxID=5970 RepID=A0AAN6IYM2_EXODE|nr:hypothetical protein HRR74_000784 [Exophiala dermatitidis]KAJ4528662.1 hypothetical protein HRR73_001285 [Exophiala dermatitidis]KAJ4530040.1 hypothetical protein HRR76_009281 [Exophiala dermatitidis]KAJ4558803.1 hypothetical protein HRR77_000782 [Exophiala dermatitidis]KAJ4581168.1 hypothetical protein HRR79_000215 [Exophiala dermatitidis]
MSTGPCGSVHLGYRDVGVLNGRTTQVVSDYCRRNTRTRRRDLGSPTMQSPSRSSQTPDSAPFPMPSLTGQAVQVGQREGETRTCSAFGTNKMLHNMDDKSDPSATGDGRGQFEALVWSANFLAQIAPLTPEM